MKSTLVRTIFGSAGIAVAAFALGGCGGEPASTEGEPVTPETLVGDWTLVSGSGADGEIKKLDQEITAAFEGGEQISTTVGCNNIFGGVEVGESGAVAMGPLAMTMMMCDEPLMELESSYATALEAVDHGSISGDKLILVGDGVSLEYKQAG